MKKTTRIFGILLIAAMLLGLLAMTASAATVERMDGFTVKVTDLVYTTDGSSISSANFHSISYKVVNSTTIQFTYSVWLYEGAGSGGSSRADQTATLNNYSCTEDIDVKIPMTYSNGSGRRNWTYNLSVTKAAGHVYDNACDTECNICKATRTITHDHQGGNCTTDAVCTVCGDVKTAPGHNYAAGACTTCGEACPHTDNSPVIIDNRNGTHTEKYNCCGLVVSTTDHQLDAEGFCTTAGCGGYQAAVLNGDTYEISNAGQLYWFAQHVNSGNQYANGRLTANITVNTNVLTATGDLNGDPASFRAWTPIDEYRGSFHGDGYVISGLYAKAYGVGFISYGSNVKVYNLGVMDSYFENTGYASGAIVGYMASNGTMENCFSNATIAGSSYISGGLVGEANHYAAVRNCYYFGKTVGGAFAYSGFSWYGSKSGNNYYVSTVDDGCEFTTAISADILASGELAYLLNGSVNGGAAWGQVIGTDAYPTPVAGENEKVYRTTLCNGDQGYANAETITEHDPSVTAADRFNEAGQCLVCGTQTAASVTTAGNVTTYYVDIYAAAAYAAAQDHSTMILLADVDLDTGKGLFEDIRNKVNVTLDLNGKTLSSENSHTINWNIYGHQEAHVTLTINDSVGTGKVINRKFNAVTTSTHLVINGGYFEAGIGKNTQAFAISSSSNGLSYKDTVMINGGTFHSNNGISSSSLSYMVINGGTFTGVTSVIHSAYEGQFVINGGNFPEGITTRVEWSEPIAKLLAHGVFLRDENGAIVTLTETQSKVSGAVTASKGANLETDGAAVTANTAAYPYTNLEHKPTATVVIGGQTLIEGQDYTLSWSNNVNIGASAVVTATGIGDFSGSAFGTFEITKGTLKVATNPETTYEFGDVATDKAVTGGKVVIVGNESAVIPGTWAWIVPGETAQFTPDAQYVDLFEALTEAVTVTHVVTPATPVIEVVTPSPSIMPGMAIRMSVVVKNPHNGELTDLPTNFRVTYRIGENGTPVTVSGLEFTLPTTGIALGDKVYVTVENVAVSGKYAVAASTNTIELAVGQVDYTAAIKALEEKLAALEAEHGADVTALEAELAALQAAVAALDGTFATDEELAQAVNAINETIVALTNRIITLENTYATKAELEAAIAELNAAITAGDAASAETLAAAVENLEQKMAAAVAALEKAYQDADTALKSELEALIADTKTALETAIAALDERVTQNEEDIAALRAELARLYAELNALIESNSGDIEAINQMLQSINTVLETLATKADVAAEVAILTDLIDALASRIANNEANINANINAISTLRQTLNALASTVAAQDAALAQSISSLSAALNALEARVSQNETNITALQEALAKAIQELNAAIAAGDEANAEALAAAVEAMEKALADAVAALETADAENKAALEAMIAEAKAALEEAIAQLRSDLEDAVENLENADKENAEALAKAIEDLTAAIRAAEATAAAEDAKIREELKRAKGALYASILKVATDLETAKTELQQAIANGDAALEGKIAELTTALNAAIVASNAADEALKAELTAAIAAGDAALQAAIDTVAQNLAKAEAELAAAIAAGDKKLEDKVTALTTALENAIAASEAADAALKTELNARIDEAVAALEKAIAQVQKNLDEALAVQEEKDAAQDQMIIIALVIACVGVAGCVALLVYIIIDKRKKA